MLLVSGEEKILPGFKKRRFKCSIFYMYLVTSRNEAVWNHLELDLACSPLLDTHKAASEMGCSVLGLLNQGVNHG